MYNVVGCSENLTYVLWYTEMCCSDIYCGVQACTVYTMIQCSNVCTRMYYSEYCAGTVVY